MPKALFLLRHAKAANGSPLADDHARPLNERGQDAATRMGREMAESGLIPEQVFCSDAARTSQTLDFLQKGLGRSLPVTYTGKLYLASPGDILHLVNALPDEASKILLIGHNPGFHLFAHGLYTRGDEALLLKLEEKFPTATLVAGELPDKPWAEIAPGDGRLTRCIRPEDLD